MTIEQAIEQLNRDNISRHEMDSIIYDIIGWDISIEILEKLLNTKQKNYIRKELANHLIYQPREPILKTLLKLNLLREEEAKIIYLGLLIDNSSKCLHLVEYIKSKITEDDIIKFIIESEQITPNIMDLISALLRENIDITKMPKVMEKIVKILGFALNHIINHNYQIKIPENKQKAFIELNPQLYVMFENLAEEFTGLRELGDIGL